MSSKKPRSGEWIALDTAFVGNAILPIRRGQRHPWDHPAVQLAPELFVSADLTPDDLRRAIAEYRNADIDAAAAAASASDRMTSSGIPVTVPRSS